MQQDNKQYWSTIVTIPLLEERSAIAFMEMIYVVARLAKVPKKALWSCSLLDKDQYEVVDSFTNIPFSLPKDGPKVKIREYQSQ